MHLDGSGSSDPNGDPLTYQWSQTGGPSVILASATAVKPRFTAPPDPVALTFRLVVGGRLGLSSSPSSVTITTQARAPANTLSPTIAGRARVGSAVMCKPGA